MCDWPNPSCLTIRIQGQAINQPSDLYVLTAYLPPEHSSYLKSTQTDTFLLLNKAYQQIPPTAHILIMGDFNTHMGTLSGHIPAIHAIPATQLPI